MSSSSPDLHSNSSCADDPISNVLRLKDLRCDPDSPKHNFRSRLRRFREEVEGDFKVDLTGLVYEDEVPPEKVKFGEGLPAGTPKYAVHWRNARVRGKALRTRSERRRRYSDPQKKHRTRRQRDIEEASKYSTEDHDENEDNEDKYHDTDRTYEPESCLYLWIVFLGFVLAILLL